MIDGLSSLCSTGGVQHVSSDGAGRSTAYEQRAQSFDVSWLDRGGCWFEEKQMLILTV